MIRFSGNIPVFLLSLGLILFLLPVGYVFTPAAHAGPAPQATVVPAGITPTVTATPTATPRAQESGNRRRGGGPPSIPEPMTIVLTGLGLAGLAGYAVRRKNNQSADD